MPELALVRTPKDRRLYEIEGLGTLRLEGLWSRRATAEAGADSWQIGAVGFWRRTIHATDGLGTLVGTFAPATLRRGGTLTWAGRVMALRPASAWRQRYALADGDNELALLDGRSWGKQPVKITVDDLGAVEPGLLLMTAFVVRRLAEDAANAS